MINRLFQLEKAFDAAYEPVDEGYLYYPWVWSKGYLVTEAEFQRLKADYLAMGSGRNFLILVAVLFGAAIMMAVLELTFGVDPDANPWINLIVVLPIIGLMLRPVFASHWLVWGRDPIAPRRSLHEADVQMAKGLSWFVIAISVAVLPMWFLAGVFLLIGGKWWGLLVLAAGLFASYRMGRTIYLKIIAE